MGDLRVTFHSIGKSYHLQIDRINPCVLTAGSTGRIKRLAGYLQSPEIIEGDRGLVVVHGTFKGTPVSGVTTGMGPASCAIVLPEVFERMQEGGFLLRIGTAGSLQPYVQHGHAVVATASIRDEDTTQALVGPEYPAIASHEFLPFLIRALESQGFLMGTSLWLGTVHSKSDLYFKETPHFSPRREELKRRLDSYQRMGALASEMELSVHFLMKDFYAQAKKRILAGGILGIVAVAPDSGRVIPKEDTIGELENRLTRAGLEALHGIWNAFGKSPLEPSSLCPSDFQEKGG